MIRKRDYFNSVVGQDRRIHDDVLSLNHDEFWEVSQDPYFASSTAVIFLTRGSLRISINMTDFEVMSPAMIAYIDGMIVRHLEASEDAESDVFIFSKSFSDEVLAEANVSNQLRTRLMTNPVFPMHENENVIMSFKSIMRDMIKQDSQFKSEAVKHLALSLYYGYALRGENLLERKKSRSERITDEFFSLVKEHYRYCRDVTYYASRLCITPKYLSQSVKDITGKPALSCIDDFVCAEAKALLRSTSMSIEQISDTLSFPNQSLFGKYFKRITGMSPRQYRNSTK